MDIKRNYYAFGSSWHYDLPSFYDKCFNDKFAYVDSDRVKDVVINKGDVILLKYGAWYKI